MSVRELAQQACDTAGIRIDVLHDWRGTDDARTVFDAVWPSTNEGTQVTPNFITAIAHSGGFVSVAYDRADGTPIGGCLAIVGRHKNDAGEWEDHLHSHLTAVLPSVRDRGVGTALKFDQRAWAHEQGIPLIGWTFDPLVRRNAWLNLVKLGATVGEYLPNFYGVMFDELNANDESDRLYAWWRTDRHEPREPIDSVAEGDVVVPLPPDIISVRADDPQSAQHWRIQVREAMNERLKNGWYVRGLTPDHSYVLSKETP